MCRRDSTTLQDLDDRGHDLRAWCFTCARGARVQIFYVRRFAALTLAAAAPHFRCLACDSSAAVALYPATRHHSMPAPKDAPARDPDRVMTGADMVAAIYFGARAAAKAAKRDPQMERTAAELTASLQARKDAPKRVPTKPPNLRIVGTKPRQ